MIFIAGDYNTPNRNVKRFSNEARSQSVTHPPTLYLRAFPLSPYNSGLSTFDSNEASVSSSLVSCTNEAI